MGAGNSARAAKMTITLDGVKDLISSDKIVIFSKSTCPYCNKVKEIFDKLNQKYTAIELNKRDDTDAFQDILAEITGARTVPRVFINGEFVGGCSDVQDLEKKGELVKKL